MFKLLKSFFIPKKKKAQIKKELEMHRILIAEYERIQNKTSKLNRARRDDVIKTVNELIEKGDIIVDQLKKV